VAPVSLCGLLQAASSTRALAIINWRFMRGSETWRPAHPRAALGGKFTKP
jgi:hypothetical protein